MYASLNGADYAEKWYADLILLLLVVILISLVRALSVLSAW